MNPKYQFSKQPREEARAAPSEQIEEYKNSFHGFQFASAQISYHIVSYSIQYSHHDDRSKKLKDFIDSRCGSTNRCVSVWPDNSQNISNISKIFPHCHIKFLISGNLYKSSGGGDEVLSTLKEQKHLSDMKHTQQKCVCFCSIPSRILIKTWIYFWYS